MVMFEFASLNNLTANIGAGVIGSADGPTAILVTTSPIDWTVIAILAVVVAALAALFVYKMKHRKKKIFRRKDKIDDKVDKE